MMVVFLIGAIHGPRQAGAIVYSTLLVIIAAIGAGIATRHVWLQHLPKRPGAGMRPGWNTCSTSFARAGARKSFPRLGECAEVGWTFLNLSIHEWSLAWFVPARRACGDYRGGRPQALTRRNPQQKAAAIASGFCALRPDVGRQLAFQVRDLIFQQEFFLFEALQLQLVLSGFFCESGYDIIESRCSRCSWLMRCLRESVSVCMGRPLHSDGKKSIFPFF